jgi:hypothetical protein
LHKSFVAIQLDLDSRLHFIKGEENLQSEVIALSTRWVWFFVNNWTHFKANSRHLDHVPAPLRTKDDKCQLLPQIA